MVLPLRPCTGVESADPACTGRAGERIWQVTWDEAVGRGLPPLKPSSSSSPTAGGGGGGNATWAMLMNAYNERSQHQVCGGGGFWF